MKYNFIKSIAIYLLFVTCFSRLFFIDSAFTLQETCNSLYSNCSLYDDEIFESESNKSSTLCFFFDSLII